MKMLRSVDVPGTISARSPDASRVPAVFVFAMWAASIWIPVHFGLDWYMGLHWGIGVLLIPFVAVGFLLWMGATRGAWQRMRGAWGAGNWVMALGPEGVYLNTRPCSNYHLPSSDLSVAYVPYSEVSTAGRIGEGFDLGGDQELRMTYRLALNLVHTDTDELLEAVQAEERSGSAWPAVIVYEPGVLHLNWCGATLYAALGSHVRTVDDGASTGAPRPATTSARLDAPAEVEQPAPV